MQIPLAERSYYSAAAQNSPILEPEHSIGEELEHRCRFGQYLGRNANHR